MTPVEVRREPFHHLVVRVQGRVALVDYPAMVWQDTGERLGWWARYKVGRLLGVFFEQRDLAREEPLRGLAKGTGS